MPEKIYLTYTNATAMPYLGTPLGHHVVLNYIDANGDHHTLQGAPANRFDHNFSKLGAFVREEVLSDGVRNTDSPFGRINAREGKGEDFDATLAQPHTPIAEGDDLSPQWALMRDFADEVNSTGYEYRPVSQNSNSFAGGALQRARLYGAGSPFPERFDSLSAYDPATGATTPRYVPGFEAPLRNPINTETPMPFPLDVRTGSPPDRRGSIDDAPQWNFASTSPSGSDAPLGIFSGKPMRFFGAPIFDTRTPSAPSGQDAFDESASQDAQGPLSLNDAYLEYLKRLNAAQAQ